MSKKTDYINIVKKVMQDNNMMAECFDKEGGITLETGTIKVRNFKNSFKMTVNEEGWLITYCPMAGKVPESILPDIITLMVTKMERLSSLKFYVDSTGVLMGSCETLLPNDPELIEPELFNTMTVLDMAYASCMPEIMRMYWNAIEETDEIK